MTGDQSDEVQGLRLRAVVEAMLSVDDEFAVYSVYQCIVRISDQTTVGWEGLARPRDWRAAADVEALFLTAREMGLGGELDWRCRRSALSEASRLEGPLFINVNVPSLVGPLDGVAQMAQICESAGRSTDSVILELSERESIPDPAGLQRSMAGYRAAGFRFSLDDTGHSDSTHDLIRAARPEYLKLSRPLTQTAGTDRAAYAAAEALVGLARDLPSTVIAEGVEDDAHLATCVSLGIDQAQGWKFGRPRPAHELRNGRLRPD